MLCCVSRRTVSGADQGSLYDHYLTKVQPVESEQVGEVEKGPEPDAPPVLEPCAICARTFKPQSLEKHTKICEQAACKKRKPFDSAKQRIQGTELAEFLPRQEKRRHAQDGNGGLKSTWKQTHDDFLRQIRAARNEIVDDTMQKQGTTLLSSSAPMRANEQGVCPTCNRHFGVKAYDRHVAWCKDRIARVQISAATNIAKERLEARMKYRAPSLKNRRQITREKYSPTSATNLHSSSKTSPTPHTSRAKGSASAPNCNKGNDSPLKQKPAVVRRTGQSKGASSPIGPMKSRPIDRSNRPPEDGSGPVIFPPVPPNKRTLLPVPPLKYKRQSPEKYNIVSSPKRKLQTRVMAKREQPSPNCRAKPEEVGQLSGRSMRSNIVSARSEGHPKLNDMSINVDVMGMTVKPCDLHPKDKLTTWKKISQAKVQSKDNIERDERASSYKYNRNDGHIFDQSLRENEPNVALDSSIASKLSSKSGSNVNWRSVTPRLNRTYSFKDSFEEISDVKLQNQKRKPVKNSPRIEFCFGDLEKLERLRSQYQRKIEKETGIDKAASKIPQDSLEELCCEEDSRMSAGCVKSARTKLLERKRLNLSCDQLTRGNRHEEKRPDSSKIVHPENNTLSDSVGVACNDFQKETDDTKEESFPDEKLPSPIFDEQFKVLEEFRELGECRKDASDSGRLSRGKYRPETTDIRKVRKENDANSVTSCFTTNEFESSVKYNDDIAEFCYIEANLIEMEPEPVLMTDVLRPSRSSTPFDRSANWKEFESLREKSITPPQNKWEMTVNEETGSELLYRVEAEEANLARRDNIDESEAINVKSSDCSTTARRINNKPLTASEEGEIRGAIVDRKDIASQATICNCSPQVADETDERSIDDNNSLERNESIKKPEKIEQVIFRTQVVTDLRGIEPSEIQSSTEIDRDYNEDNIDTDNMSTIPNRIVETIKIADEEVHEIYKNSSSKNFDCPSEDSVDENEMPEPSCSYEASVKNDLIDVRNLRSMILSESRVTVKKSANAAFKSRYAKVIGIEKRILEHVNETNDSNDSLSLIDDVDLAGVKQVETVEVETIEEIGAGSRNVRFGVLPDIKRTTIVVKKDRNKSETITTQTYWEKAPKSSKNRLINLDLPYQESSSRLLKRNPKVLALPPVSTSSSFLTKCRNLALPLRPVWSNYVRRRPDFNLVLSSRTGKDYNPFLLAEQQMNDLLSDASEQSVTDSPLLDRNRETSFPLSHSSAFVKYPYQTSPTNPGKRSSLIAPPTEFDDLASDFSSDSTETNSLCREVYLKDDKQSKSDFEKKSPVRELGRRVIIDKSKALGGDVTEDNDRGSRSFVGNSDRARKILDKVSPKVVRPTVNRSFSVRASSAPKASLDKKNSSNDTKTSSGKNNDPQRSSNASLNNRNNNYMNLSTSNLSLSSIVSSDVDIKRSNSVFDELMTSFDDENSSFASLKSLLKSDSLSVSSPVHGRQRNDQNSDEELSSPESYKRQDHGKFSGDSAYSSLNRKYSHHGRSTNDVAGRSDEDHARQNRGRSDGEGVMASSKCKMSKFCHECGSKFPETAKFCCECGIRRLVL
ncbi:uncharacterized protein LOC143364151 [Halictus rubicundus]|uniref:uncharacterized protein LOC143364151 n=1 Tax=Halictus rubicundus TaxID=77578 RepID=UPI0040359696